LFRHGTSRECGILLHGVRKGSLIEIPIREQDRGGFTARLSMLRDHQLLNLDASISVPFDNKKLKIEFSTFRGKLRLQSMYAPEFNAYSSASGTDDAIY
jgi:hypothetical protein